MQRGRRLRRARALRDNVPYRLEIHSLDNLYAVRDALSEVAQALAAGQLDPGVAGKLLYAIQQASSANRRIEQMEAAQLERRKDAENKKKQVRVPGLDDNLDPRDDDSRIQEYPEFDKQFSIPAGVDLDVLTDAVLQKADEEA